MLHCNDFDLECIGCVTVRMFDELKQLFTNYCVFYLDKLIALVYRHCPLSILV